MNVVAGTTAPSADETQLARQFLPFTSHKSMYFIKNVIQNIAYINTVTSETIPANSTLWIYDTIIERIKMCRIKEIMCARS